jgi:hypothetical protein
VTISRIVDSEVIVTEKTFNYLGVESLVEKILSLGTEQRELAAKASAPSALDSAEGGALPGGAPGAIAPFNPETYNNGVPPSVAPGMP